MDKENQAVEDEVIETTEDSTEDGWDEGEVEEDEPTEKANEDKEEEPAAETPKAKLPDEEFHKAEVKKYQDRFARSKEAETILRNAAKALEKDGLLDREDLAKEMGLTRGQLDAVLDRKELPEAGEDGHMQLVQQKFVEDYHNPSLQRGIERLYGTKEEQAELLQAFDWAVGADPELSNKYKNIQPEEVVYFALDEGKAALEDFRDSQTKGGVKSLLAENRALQARIAELENPETVSSETETEEEVEEPKAVRKATQTHLDRLLA